MSDDRRVCSHCRRSLPQDAFIPSQRRRRNGGYCKECRNAMAREKRTIQRQQREQAALEMIAAGVKVCRQCSATLPRPEFHNDRRRKDGLFPYCRSCRMERDGRAASARDRREREQRAADLLAVGLKVCQHCDETLPVSEFPKDRQRPDGLLTHCESCRRDHHGRSPRQPSKFASKSEYDRHYRGALSAAERTARSRRGYLWTTYRLTEDVYQAMHDAQGGRCLVCGDTEQTQSQLGNNRRLAVDHDHACCPGKSSCGSCIRGLLCHACNAGIGHFKDDPDRMAKAIEYLGGDGWAATPHSEIGTATSSAGRVPTAGSVASPSTTPCLTETPGSSS